MPKPGFRTISIRDDLFDWFDGIYSNKKILRELNPGITSLSLFFTEQMEISIKENNAMRTFISQIKYVPEKFTILKLQLKPI